MSPKQFFAALLALISILGLIVLELLGRSGAVTAYLAITLAASCAYVVFFDE